MRRKYCHGDLKIRGEGGEGDVAFCFLPEEKGGKSISKMKMCLAAEIRTSKKRGANFDKVYLHRCAVSNAFKILLKCYRQHKCCQFSMRVAIFAGKGGVPERAHIDRSLTCP